MYSDTEHCWMLTTQSYDTSDVGEILLHVGVYHHQNPPIAIGLQRENVQWHWTLLNADNTKLWHIGCRRNTTTCRSIPSSKPTNSYRTTTYSDTEHCWMLLWQMLTTQSYDTSDVGEILLHVGVYHHQNPPIAIGLQHTVTLNIAECWQHKAMTHRM